MKSKCWLFLCFVIGLCTVGQSSSFLAKRMVRSVSSRNDSVSSILDFLNSQDGKWLGTEKNVVLVLGNTGVGKSTLGTLITNSTNLVSKGSPETAEFLLDDNNRISSDCTIKSKTHIPELVVDSINSVPYYDCPGFGDTRVLQYELVQTYFIRRILDYSDSVKFVFVIDSASMKKGGDRKNFPRLAKYATSIIKDIQKYSKSIALIITKVENTYSLGDDGISIKLVDDDSKKRSVVGFLTEMKKDLRADGQSEENESIIKFIDIISETNDGKYEKIGLFRVPNKAGPVKDIPLMLATTKNLVQIVTKNINFTETNMNDFGFTLSAESMNTVRDRYDEMFNNLKANIQRLNEDVIKFYMDKEKQLTDIFKLKQLMQYGYDNVTLINEPSVSRVFFDKIVYTLHSLGVSVSGENLNNILRNIEYVNILSQVSNYNPVSTPELKLSKALDYLNNSFKWYTFLTDLYDSLSTYNIQNKMPILQANIKKLKLNIDAAEIRIADIGLKSFLEAINSNKYSEIGTMRINSVQLKALKDVLEQMTSNEVSEVCNAQKMTVSGKFVKISDVVKMKCWPNAKDIRVFASNALFIDADLDKSEKEAQITFIAPTWCVFGKRMINLNGKNATHPTSAAKDGSKDADKNGSVGKVGSNGGQAGHFFGIGKRFFDSEFLEIYANGGSGANGQNGGKGADGIETESVPITPADNFRKLWDNMGLSYKKIHEWKETSFATSYTYYEYEITYGRNAIDPGRGGNGGAGGFGGQSGNVSIIGFWQMPNVYISKKPGNNGAAGKGGDGGKGTVSEKEFKVRLEERQSSNFGAYAPSIFSKTSIQSSKTTKTQPNGANGQNGVGNPSPVEVLNILIRARLAIAYKENTLEYLI